jgi:simple sugar transport system permease protein
VRLAPTLRRELSTAALALLVAMLAGSLLILIYGQSPARVYALMIARTLGDAYGFGQLLFRATPLVFTGLAVALAFRAGLFNIGAEGQLAAGSMAAGMVGASLPAATPALVAVPVCLAAAAAAGGVVGGIPGVLRARFGAHEVIVTMMMNFIVAGAVLWLGKSGYFVAHTVHTAPVVAGARLPALGLAGSSASVAFLLALAAALGVHLLVTRTRWGFELRALGQSAEAARAGGVAIGRRLFAALALSGALAGLVGSATVLGYKGFHEEGLGSGAGFMGIAVALLGRGHAGGVIAASLVLGFLAQGALAASALVPKEIVDVLQAVIILSVAAASASRAREEQA